MSLDGFIAGPGESGFDLLFNWYENGEVEVPTANPEMTFKVTPQSAAWISGYIGQTGALICGRHLFDFTSGWGGQHTLGVHTFVVTHSVPSGWENAEHFTFVTDGIESAVAQAKAHAGDRIVGVNGGTIARQCLDAGLLDEIYVDLVPVLLGSGTPFFSELRKSPVSLEGPLAVVEGKNVTHLRYRVKYN
ncbi:deaminase [Lentzea sp. NBRC 105346]|uniref:dihydrofolate reductase family protein n=1 Tax=Lentzea sp. NBRC 105346 TaxID=3032205 RepID=UPI0024A37BCD|nr:dihydrofolate reductase family protein [Lentzea sp. NBRC 105346]GLZ34715.1 deaminase [Lentzea sp. NBRC 105346]